MGKAWLDQQSVYKWFGPHQIGPAIACGGNSIENDCLEFELVDRQANMPQEY